MTKDERNDIYKAAKSNGYRESSDGSRLINNNGGSVRFEGTNRTVINGSTYYGASDAKNKLK